MLADVDAPPVSRRSELLQVLLVVLLGFVHVVLILVILMGGVLVGLGVGVLELAAGRKMPATLAVLKTWLLVVGTLVIVFSLVFLAYFLIASS